MGGDAVWAIVVAGGTGRRYGGEKQFELLGGRPVHTWAVEAAHSVAQGVVLVVPDQARAAEALRVEAAQRAEIVVTGGATRAASVRAGLSAVPLDAALILVHDAARPLASPPLFERVVAAVRRGADAAIPGLPIPDTVKQVEDDIVRATLDRRELVRVQTPQCFVAAALRRAHAGERDATDDASLLESLGVPIVVVAGEEHNLKITTPSDLALAQWWLEQRAGRADSAGAPERAGGG
jgi:2-C-methyl-D-erythritol 4-phosphate cytidylyltransferase